MEKLVQAIEKSKKEDAENRRFEDSVGSVIREPLSPEKELARIHTETKVIKVSHDVLRRNKVFALFHDNAATDRIKILRTQIINRLKVLRGNSLLVTSTKKGEGKTFISVNLAVSISHVLDRTVLLVDADLRAPSIHQVFGLDIDRGLSDYLLNQENQIPDLLINPGIRKLTLLPGGKPILQSSEHLGASRMARLVKEMKKRYTDRYIIFDSASLLDCADPLIFSRYVDAVLFVVEAERTSVEEIKRSCELLKSRPLAGTVFNKAPHTKKQDHV
jgi:non-specific protein-tyrosine kinase